MVLNARSLLPKIDEMKVVTQIRSPSIIFISETWLNETVPTSMVSLANYVMTRADRCYRRGGGVAVYIRAELLFTDITPQFRKLQNIDYLVLDVHSCDILLICIYIPPSVSAELLGSVHVLLTDVTDSFLSKYSSYHVIIAGDMNQFDTATLCSDLGMRDIITKPTRQGSILDHVLMTEELARNYDSDRVIYDSPVGSADHKTISCVPNRVKTVPISLSWHKVYDFRRTNLEYLMQQANLVNWNELLVDAETVNASWSSFHRVLSELVSHCIPSRTVPITTKDKEWITPLTKLLIIDKWRAFHSRNWGMYNHLKGKVKREIQRSKQIWADRFTHTTSGLWKLVNRMNRSMSADCSLLTNSCLTEDELMKILTSNLSQHFAHTGQLCEFSSSVLTCEDDDWNVVVSELQVRKMLQRYPIRKAAGRDGIPTRIYVELADIIASPLSVIFNQSCQQKIFPSEWKRGLIVPVPKTNPPDVTKLRFITLLPLPAKLLERLVLQGLNNKFIQAFGSEQHGFRLGASTTTALLTVVNAAARMYDDKNLFGVAMVNYDLSSAFDFVDHELIMKRLTEGLFPNGFLKWLQSYLCDRTGELRIKQKISQPFRVLRGVPQGSVLGPPLFCVFSSSFCATLPEVTVVKYADDTSLVVPLPSCSAENISSKIELETQNMENWCTNNKMKLNLAKSKCLIITRRDIGELKLSVERVTSVKLLGLHINQRLNWNTHVDYLRRTCGRRLHLLRRLRSLVPYNDLFRIYEAIIRSLLEYACPLFIGVNKKQTKILQLIQKRALRIISAGKDNSYKADSLHDRRTELSHRLWQAIESEEDHILRPLLPAKFSRSGHYVLPSYRTNTYGDTFFPFFTRLLNSRLFL